MTRGIGEDAIHRAAIPLLTVFGWKLGAISVETIGDAEGAQMLMEEPVNHRQENGLFSEIDHDLPGAARALGGRHIAEREGMAPHVFALHCFSASPTEAPLGNGGTLKVRETP